MKQQNIYQFFFIDAARLSLKIKNKRAVRKTKKNKKWFDAECITLRKELRSLLNAVNRYPYSFKLRQKYFMVRKAYNQIIKRKKHRFKMKLVNALHESINEDPSTLWKTLKLLKESEETENKIVCPLNPEKWLQHLEKLIGTKPTVQEERNTEIESAFKNLIKTNNSYLDRPFTTNEVAQEITKLKNKKSPGIDGINNEMIKSGGTHLIEILKTIFNLVLETGIYPVEWKIGVNIPIYKSGCPLNTSNYRGITLTNSIGKLFCQIINRRICEYLERNKILSREQAGFRKNHRTTDQIFILSKLVDNVMKTRNRRLYCCFVDFQKAFDNVWHEALFLKLYDAGVTGKCLNVIVNMYENASICTRIKDKYSGNILIRKGVHQGNTLSPTFFNIFINDIVQYISGNDSPMITTQQQIPCLLYADDLALLSNTKAGLQMKLNLLYEYCTRWGLHINRDKTKVIIFTRSPPKIPIVFKCGDLFVETTDKYKYLGIMFYQNGNFTESTKYLSKQAATAIHTLRRAVYGQNIRVDIMMKLFDALVAPIITYGAEVWFPMICRLKNNFRIVDIFSNTISNCYPHENMHTKFCKQILGVHKKAMVLPTLGELGRFPLTIKILSQMVAYWVHILESDRNSYMYLLYQDLQQNDREDKWLRLTRETLQQLGLSHIWSNQSTLSVRRLKHTVQNKLEDMFQKFWSKEKSDISKLRFYDDITSNYRMESYLTLVINKNHRYALSKFRISAHDLMIEMGRYQNLSRDERKCLYCNEIEDEYHFLDKCLLFTKLRNDTLEDMLGNDSNCNRCDVSSFIRDTNKQAIIAKFVYNCFLKRSKFSSFRTSVNL